MLCTYDVNDKWLSFDLRESFDVIRCKMTALIPSNLFLPFRKDCLFYFYSFLRTFFKALKSRFFVKAIFLFFYQRSVMQEQQGLHHTSNMLLKMTLKHVHCNIFRVWNRFILPMRDYYFRDAFEASSIFRADGTVGNFFLKT